MSESKLDFAKKIAKAHAARQRQFDKQKEKIASPEYQKAQQEKQQTSQIKSQQRAFEKMKARLDDPAYREEKHQKQRESQIKAVEKQRARQQVKEAPAGYAIQNTQPLNTRPDKLRKKTTKTKAISPIDVKRSKSIKSKGLKGRAPTALEKKLGNKIGDIGCICCLNKKWYTTDMAEQEGIKFVSLHHVDGRTKQWAHAKVLPLCAYHHDTPAPNDAPDELTAIHRGNKKEWVVLNGTEGELLKQVYEIIDEDRPWLVRSAAF
jgi:hypothetical protein